MSHSAADGAASRLSIDSASTVNYSSRGGLDDTTSVAMNFDDSILMRASALPQMHKSRYSISKVLTNPKSASSYIPQLSLAGNPYLPRSINTLGTTFTSAALPKESTESKHVAQRRAVAPPLALTPVRAVDAAELAPYTDEIRDAYMRWRSACAAHDAREARDAPLQTSTPVRGGGTASERLPLLEHVPRLFFRPGLNFSDTDTFAELAEELAPSVNAGGSQVLPGTPVSRLRNAPIGSGPLSPITSGDAASVPSIDVLAASNDVAVTLREYASIVDAHLVREIELRSDSFFAALANLHTLRAQGDACRAQAVALRAALSADGLGRIPHTGLRVLRLQARRRALQKVSAGLKAVDEVHQGLRGLDELVASGEWIAALEVAEELDTMYRKGGAHQSADHNEATHSARGASRQAQFTTAAANSTGSAPAATLDLTRIRALDSVPRKLAAVRAQINATLESELLAVLSDSLGGAIRDETEHPIADNTFTERTMERLRPIAQGLVRSGGLANAVGIWRDAVLKEVRARVRKFLPVADLGDDDDLGSIKGLGLDMHAGLGDKSAVLAKNLRYMTHESFVKMSRSTYASIVACLEVAAMQSTVLIDLLSDILAREDNERRTADEKLGTALSNTLSKETELGAAAPSPATPGLDSFNQTIKPEISGVVHTAAELANLRFSRVMSVRAEIHSHLSLEEFVELYEMTWAFVLRCEVISQRMTVGLRSVIVSQAKAFMAHFHAKSVSEAAKTVENEHWVAVDIPNADQAIVGEIVQIATSDPPGLLIKNSRGHLVNQSIDHSASYDAKTSRKHILIEDHAFFAVGAVLSCVRAVAEYLKVILNCDVLTIDCVSKIVEFLKTFNSRTCQVVLGAGAMRSAGLKNITARHLALASQSLSIMVSLIPYIREGFRRHLTDKQGVMLTEFDKLKRDYLDHQSEIHNKLISIMEDRLEMFRNELAAINWDDPKAKSDVPNHYMELLVKDHLTLNKVLNRYLPAETVADITMQVFSSLNAGLADIYSSITLQTFKGKERMLRDVGYLKERLAELKGMEERTHPGEELMRLVEMKRVGEQRVKEVPSAEEQEDEADRAVTTDLNLPDVSADPLQKNVPKASFESATKGSLDNTPKRSLESTPKRSLDSTPRRSLEETPKKSLEQSTKMSLESESSGRGSLEGSAKGVATSVATAAATSAVPHRKTMAERLAELTRGIKRQQAQPMSPTSPSDANSAAPTSSLPSSFLAAVNLMPKSSSGSTKNDDAPPEVPPKGDTGDQKEDGSDEKAVLEGVTNTEREDTTSAHIGAEIEEQAPKKDEADQVDEASQSDIDQGEASQAEEQAKGDAPSLEKIAALPVTSEATEDTVQTPKADGEAEGPVSGEPKEDDDKSEAIEYSQDEVAEHVFSDTDQGDTAPNLGTDQGDAELGLGADQGDTSTSLDPTRTASPPVASGTPLSNENEEPNSIKQHTVEVHTDTKEKTHSNEEEPLVDAGASSPVPVAISDAAMNSSAGIDLLDFSEHVTGSVAANSELVPLVVPESEHAPGVEPESPLNEINDGEADAGNSPVGVDSPESVKEALSETSEGASPTIISTAPTEDAGRDISGSMDASENVSDKTDTSEKVSDTQAETSVDLINLEAPNNGEASSSQERSADTMPLLNIDAVADGPLSDPSVENAPVPSPVEVLPDATKPLPSIEIEKADIDEQIDALDDVDTPDATIPGDSDILDTNTQELDNLEKELSGDA